MAFQRLVVIRETMMRPVTHSKARHMLKGKYTLHERILISVAKGK